jgi:hypothetical protein
MSASIYLLYPLSVVALKWSLPQDAETQAEVDAWFAGEFCARVVEVARGPL